MPVPVITTTQSVLEPNQFGAFAFQPAASGLITNPQPNNLNLATQKPFAVAATIAALATSSYAANVITASANGALSINGYAVVAGDVVLIKNETAAERNGLYVVTNPGGASTAFVLTRHAEMNTTAGFVGYVFDLKASQIWLCPTNTITVGTTAVNFVQYLNRWQTSALPEGLAINLATGQISGTPTIAGLASFSLIASNDSGVSWSAAVTFSLSIRAQPISSHTGKDVAVELTTGAVTSAAPASGTSSGLAPILEFKDGDNELLYVRFTRNGTGLDLGTLTSFKLGLKEFEGDALIGIGGGENSATPLDFTKIGSGENAVYIMGVNVTWANLQAAFSNYGTDEETSFVAVAELEMIFPNATGVGPNPRRLTTSSFGLKFTRDLLDN